MEQAEANSRLQSSGVAVGDLREVSTLPYVNWQALVGLVAKYGPGIIGDICGGATLLSLLARYGPSLLHDLLAAFDKPGATQGHNV